jgi:hypothetical protein
LVIALPDSVITLTGMRSSFGAGWNWSKTTCANHPQRRGAILARTPEATFLIGAQLLKASVTLFDAFVADEVVTGYGMLGSVVDD